jgi:lysophospholipase L1-like esterase
MLGNGASIVSSPSAVFTLNGCTVIMNGNQTITANGFITMKKLIISDNDTVTLNGTSTVSVDQTTGASPLTMGEYSVLQGNGALSLRSTVSCLPITSPVTAKIKLTNELSLVATNTTGNVVITVPSLDAPSTKILLTNRYAGTVTHNLLGDINSRWLTISSIGAGGNLTLESNNKSLTAQELYFGNQVASTKTTLNLGSSVVTAGKTSTLYKTDSVIINCAGTTIINPIEWTIDPKTIITGTYTTPHASDLFMGHSMLVPINLWESAYWYEKNYAHRYYKNRAIAGSIISNANSRVDSCLTAYTPTRFFLLHGRNDFNTVTAGTLESQYTAYMASWRSIIAKVKAFGITDSIYIIEMSPDGYNTPERASLIKTINARIKDSCKTNGLYWIETYAQLGKPSNPDSLNTLYSTDGLHPNSTLAGSQYCGYLFSRAYKVGGGGKGVNRNRLGNGNGY